jgi:hypothetical protein
LLPDAGCAILLPLATGPVPAAAWFIHGVCGSKDIMRTLILLGLVGGGLVAAGAIHLSFSQQGNQIEISIDKQKVEAVAEGVLREGQTIMQNVRTASPAGQQVR